MYRPVVLCGSSHPLFAALVAERLGIGLINVLRGKYANGETQFELRESVRGADVYIVQTNCHPVNDMLMELMIMVQTCRYAAAHRIIAVLPFFPYGRQDKMKSWLQPITAKLVASMLTSAGVHHVITMNLHAAQLQGFFDIPCDNLNSQVAMVPWIQRHLPNWRDAVIVAPDNGAVRTATSISSQLGLQMAMLHKQRHKVNEVANMILVGDVRNKLVIVVDDMTDTSETLCHAADRLHAAGASKIYACITHGVFSNQAVDKIMESHYELVVCTNTLPMPQSVLNRGDKFRVIDVTNIFAKYIKSMHEQKNYQRMFKLTTSEIFDGTVEQMEEQQEQSTSRQNESGTQTQSQTRKPARTSLR